MKQGIITIMVLTILVATGCSTAEKADLVITGGKVFTADSLNPYAEAIAVRSNRIIAVGSVRRVSRHIDQATTKVINAAGKTVIPGFNDAHAHFGGEIMRDPVTGEPTGILKESAMELIKTGAVKTEMSSEEAKEKEWRGYITALRQAAEYGITSIQIPGSADFEMYDAIMEAGMLTSRIDIGGVLTADTEKPDRYEELRRGFWLATAAGSRWKR